MTRPLHKKMILIIDNYDSFTYNLVQYLGELLLQKGMNPDSELVVYRNDQISLAEIERLTPRKIVISPGPCTPKEAGISVPLIQKFAGRFPILGVCLGHQAIGAAFGGNVIRASRIMHGKTSDILHDGKTIFQDVQNPFVATRYHSLIIEKQSLPPELEISAWTKEDEIMAVRHKTLPIEGVQFHPESILTKVGKKILENFLTP